MQPVNSNEVAYAPAGVGIEALETLDGAERYNEWIASFFEPFLGENNLELGAGLGAITDVVAQRWRVTPFEIEAPSRAALSARFAGNPRVGACGGDVLQCTAFGQYDAIYSANVLEHIVDDAAIIEHSAKLLKPGGWFVAFVPAGRWLYSDFDRLIGHHRRYGNADRSRLGQLGARIGLPLRVYKYVNAPGAVGWFLRMRLLKKTRIDPADVKASELLLPLIRAFDRLPWPFGQSAVIAMQRHG